MFGVSEKGLLIRGDSKSTIVLVFILEDCKRDHGGRLVKRSNIMGNASRYEETTCTLG